MIARKYKSAGQNLGAGFSWYEAADAAADIYSAVSYSTSQQIGSNSAN